MKYLIAISILLPAAVSISAAIYWLLRWFRVPPRAAAKRSWLLNLFGGLWPDFANNASKFFLMKFLSAVLFFAGYCFVVLVAFGSMSA
jgi:hypothetical protein